MKTKVLKSIIETIVREIAARKLGEGQPVGGVRNDHPFDAGRNNVMKAVNIAETQWDSPEDKPKVYSKLEDWLKDNIKDGVYIGESLANYGFTYKRGDKVNMGKGYLLLAMRVWNDAKKKRNDNLKMGPPIGYEESIGQDGRYDNDMESGVAVKKLHNLDETGEGEENLVNDLKHYHEVGVKCGTAQKRRDQGMVSQLKNWYDRAVRLENPQSQKLASDAFNAGYREGTGVGSQRPTYFRENDEEKISGKFVNRGEVKLEGGLDYETAYKIASNQWDIFGQSGKDERGVWNFQTRGNRWCCSVGMLNGQPAMLSVTTTPGRLHLLVGKELDVNDTVNEESSTGAVAGYSTPFAFSKKGGSKKALDVTTKMGYKKVKDID